MSDKIEQLRGGVARVASMQGIGWPRIAFAPDDDKGQGDGKAGNNGDGDSKSGDGTGDNDGADDSGGKGGKSSLDGKGLFGRRSKQDGGDGDQSNNDGTGDDKTGDLKDGRPEGLSDKFWDAKNKTVNATALAKAYTDLEKAHGTLKRSKSVGGEVPEDADDYFKEGVKLPDTVDRLGLPSDDPGLKVAASVFQKYGIGKDAAHGIIKDIFAGMNEYAPMPIDPDAEFEALGKGGEALIDGVFAWVEGGERAGKFSEDDIGVIEGMTQTAAGMKLLAKFREMTGEQRIPIDPGTGKRGMSQEQWNEAYKEAVKKQDYAEQARLDEIGKVINGEDPGRSGRPGGYTSEKTIAR